MHTKHILLLILALAGGVLLGHSGRYIAQLTVFRDQVSTTQEKNPATPQSKVQPPHEFSSFPSKSSTKNNSLIQLDRTLLSYSRMEPALLIQELEKIRGQNSTYSILSINDYTDFQMDIRYDFICSQLAQISPRFALQSLEKKKENHCTYAAVDILNKWAIRDPESAINYCKEKGQEDRKKNDVLYSLYFELLVQSNPEQALKELYILPAEEFPSSLPLEQLEEKIPEKLMEFYQKMKDSPHWDDWDNERIFTHFAKSDRNTALELFHSQPEDKQEYLLGHMVGSLSMEEAEQKMKNLDGYSKETALHKICYSLSAESMKKTLEWLQANATEEQIVHTIDNIYIDNPYDPALYSNLNQMPNGPVKDGLLEKILYNITSESQELSTTFIDMPMEEILSQIDNIQSQKRRDKVINYQIDHLIRQNPKMIKSWLEKSNHPPKEKKEQLKRCNDYIEQTNKAD